ncbi:hypothetical protein BMF94_1760 [Rhodotorula taiwanensis]|uniref:Uncharacterized protein n=1 Tax=Rhodotorula taiwanensis TaxID=741276 RepID=A0A2S5BEE3_9BASI|nr:hypothetical protein BMF94_1760 [Rhodotorula taiwanensis]
MQLRTLILLGAALLVQHVSTAPALLDVRDVHNCKGPFQCRYFPRPDNSLATCVANVCGWECSDGYVSAGRSCNLIATSSSSLDSSSSFPSASSLSTTLTPSLEVPPSPTTSEAPISTPVGVVGQAQFQTTQPVSTTSSTATTTTSSTTPMSSATTTTLPPPPTTMTSSSSSTTQPPPSTTEAPPPPSTTAATPTTTEPPSPTVTLIPDAVAAAGVTGFAGDNTNAIISWFRADSSQDSTNGHSWCGFEYTNAVPGFAPSLNTMLSNFNWDYEAAATAYCGLEAVITTPDGLTATLYIADAFDDTWVRTPASIDVMYDSFASLYGSVTTNKNDVVKDGSWYLTGNRNDRYKFKGLGSVGL